MGSTNLEVRPEGGIWMSMGKCKLSRSWDWYLIGESKNARHIIAILVQIDVQPLIPAADSLSYAI